MIDVRATSAEGVFIGAAVVSNLNGDAAEDGGKAISAEGVFIGAAVVSNLNGDAAEDGGNRLVGSTSIVMLRLRAVLVTHMMVGDLFVICLFGFECNARLNL